MPQKLQIHISRVNAMRIIAKAMREKTKRFNAEKKAFPRNLETYRKQVIKALHEHLKVAKSAVTMQQIVNLASTDVVDYSTRNKWNRETPELNLCELQNYLTALQNDTRKELVVSMNSELWSLLQPSTCEVIR